MASDSARSSSGTAIVGDLAIQPRDRARPPGPARPARRRDRPSASMRVFWNASDRQRDLPELGELLLGALLPDQQGQGLLEPLQPALGGLRRRQQRARPRRGASRLRGTPSRARRHSALRSDVVRRASFFAFSSASPALIRGFEPPGLNRASSSRSSSALHVQQVLEAAPGLEQHGHPARRLPGGSPCPPGPALRDRARTGS